MKNILILDSNPRHGSWLLSQLREVGLGDDSLLVKTSSAVEAEQAISRHSPEIAIISYPLGDPQSSVDLIRQATDFLEVLVVVDPDDRRGEESSEAELAFIAPDRRFEKHEPEIIETILHIAGRELFDELMFPPPETEVQAILLLDDDPSHAQWLRDELSELGLGHVPLHYVEAGFQDEELEPDYVAWYASSKGVALVVSVLPWGAGGEGGLELKELMELPREDDELFCRVILIADKGGLVPDRKAAQKRFPSEKGVVLQKYGNKLLRAITAELEETVH